MQVADPRIQVIPSFIRRANRRLAELSLLLRVHLLVDCWDTAGVEQLLHDARYLRHGLRTMARPGSLTLDEQRYIVERLLPMMPEESGAELPAEPVIPTKVRLTLTVGPPRLLGVSRTLPAQARVTVLDEVPKGSILKVSRDSVQLGQDLKAKTGLTTLLDTEPGKLYVAQIYFEGRLLGQAFATLASLTAVRWGLLPAGQDTVTLRDVASWQALAPDAQLLLPYVVPEGRYHLALLVAPDANWQLLDPQMQATITQTFIATSVTLADVGPQLLLRQPMPSIGPFTFTAQLNLS